MDGLIEFMRQTRLFEGFSGEDLEVVGGLLTEARIGPDERILAEKETSCSLYLVREGQVRISIGYPLHLKKDLPIRTIGPGEMFGEFSFIDRLPRSGVVLTGGGAMLEGLEEIAEVIFGHRVRIGTPRGLAGLVEPVATPEWAVPCGLIRAVSSEDDRILAKQHQANNYLFAMMRRLPGEQI